MLKNISILNDNYVWIIYNFYGFCVIIDPGISDPVIKMIKENNFYPIAILLTHKHTDHVGGVKNIIKMYPNIVVFGPLETVNYGATKIVYHGDKIFLLDKIFYVLFTPGHTSGHVSYYMKPYIFCGDTIFSGGCGCIDKKNYLKMFYSIRIISLLPEKTMLCCSHEYTLSNLIFSMSLLPNDRNINLYYKKIKNSKKCTLPSYIFKEKKINLFLRTDEKKVKKSIGLKESSTSFETFVQLRLKKDFFSFGAKRD